jgi:gamma-glutamyltranspeptidase/glutathione hydrolase
VVLNVLEFGLDGRAAVDAPRTHHAWLPDALTLEGSGWDPATRAALERMGHTVRTVARQGDAHSIVVAPGGGLRLGVPDRRRRTATAAGD